ncbi:MAG: hypothetical protein FWD56_03580 [Bacteroidales bacterium]|nr:hypothetical protein [Bacteroidales bacterium]
MKTFDLNTYGVVEMCHQEVMETDGGVIGFIYEYITGRSLAQDCREVAIYCLNAVIEGYANGLYDGMPTIKR